MKKHLGSERFLFVSILAVAFFASVFLIQVGATRGEDNPSDITCGPNSYLSGDQCLCSSGYGAASGSNECVPDSQVCAAYGPSHRVGDDCVCNDGYKIVNGSNYCENMNSACAQFNAVWSAAKGDCECAAGLHEDTTLNKCISDAPATPTKKEENKPVETPSTESKNPVPTTTTPKATITNPLDPINTLMNSDYNKLAPQVQAVISENQAPANQIVQTPFTPSGDLYSSNSIEPNATESVTKSLNLVTPSEQQSAKEQIALLVTFSDTPNSEVNISEGGMGEKLQEAFVEQKYTKELDTWKGQVQEAEKQSKIKEGVDPNDYSNAAEMESRMKAQIAALEKIVGFNHLRCLESTKAIKFEYQSKEYKDYFRGQSAENMFDSAAEGTAFNAAAANVTGTTTQIRELKNKLNETYPTNWKTKYLDVPAEPVRDKVVAPENIFNVFENLKNK